MKVKRLIELLSQVDQDREIVMSKDSEGNYFSPLHNIEPALYVPETTWHGETYPEELTEEMKERGFSEDDMYHGAADYQHAIVLWPVN
jgi:hypothetical protein